MPNFEAFSRRMLSLRDGPYITIHTRGTFSLNRSSFLALDEPAAVELLFDTGRNIVGLRRMEPRDERCYPVRTTSRSGNGPWIISAMAFTKYYGIDLSVSRRWQAYLEDDVLCANLSGESVAAAPGRRGSSR